MYIASVDIKTALDVAKPTHSANIMGEQETHGWIKATSLLGKWRLAGHATFESVESKFNFSRCSRQGSVDVPTLRLKMAKQLLWNRGERIEDEADGNPC